MASFETQIRLISKFYEGRRILQKRPDTTHLEASLYQFMKEAWPVFDSEPFTDGWHLKAMSEHLESVYRCDTKKLLINMPFRVGKSNLLCVCFPAWIWAQEPSVKFIFGSYSIKLSIYHSTECRRLIMSEWYQERWGHKVKLAQDRNEKTFFGTTAGGYRRITSVGSGSTGFGADIICVDDPNDVNMTESDAVTMRTNNWLANITTRANNQKKLRFICAQQRTGLKDASAYLLSLNDPSLIHYCTPMEYEHHRKSITTVLPSTHGEKWQDPRTQENQLMWPERIDEETLKIMKAGLVTEQRIAGQLQQRPAPAAGNIIKRNWFKIWDKPQPPKLKFVLQSWDTALSKDATAAYSACTTWGVFESEMMYQGRLVDSGERHVILMSMFRGRLESPDVRDTIIRLAMNYLDTNISMPPLPDQLSYRPQRIIIENQSSGSTILQDLRRIRKLNESNIIITGFNPKPYGNKIQRVHSIAHLIRAGRVWLPASPPQFLNLRPFADVFRENAVDFPSAAANDVVDSFSQALIELYIHNMINHPDDSRWSRQVIEDNDPFG